MSFLSRQEGTIKVMSPSMMPEGRGVRLGRIHDEPCHEAIIYEFGVPKWLDMVQEYTIPQTGYKNNPLNQGG